MDKLSNTEKNELAALRSRITKARNASSRKVLEEDTLPSLQEEHREFLELVTARCKTDGNEVPNDVLRIFCTYDEKLEAAHDAQTELLEKARERELMDQRLELMRKQIEEIGLRIDKANQDPTTAVKQIQVEAPQPQAGAQFYTRVPTDMIPKFDGSQADWPAFSLAIKEMLLDNPLIFEGQAKLTLLQAIKQGTEAYARAYSMYGRKFTLKQIWEGLAETYNRTDRTEAELISQAQSMPEITHTLDIQNAQKAYEMAARIETVISTLANPPASLSERLVAIFASKCHPMLRYRILHECKTVHEVAKALDYEWMIMQRYSLSQVAEPQTKPKKLFALQESRPLGNPYRSGTQQSPTHRSTIEAATPNLRPALPPTCYFCEEEGHYTDQCQAPHSDRFKLERIVTRPLCWQCLRPGHNVETCMGRKMICRLCGGDHRTMIHPIWRLHQERRTGSSTNQINTVADSYKAERLKKDKKPVGVISVNGSYCYVLADTGADRTMIAGALVRDSLRSEIPPVWFKPYEAEAFAVTEEAQLEILCMDGSTLKLPALVKRDHGCNQLILGVDYLSQLEIPPIQTPFGEFTIGEQSSAKTFSILQISEDDKPNELSDEAEDKALMEVKLVDGRFVVFLPFVNDRRPPDNFHTAMRLLESAQSRMKPGVFEKYQLELYKFVNEGHAVVTQDPRGYCLPHFAVYRDSATTSMRIVFDGSHGKLSLNDTLYKGTTPDLKLEEKLIRFRKGRYALVIDIAKAFLQISITEPDRKYLKFLWKEADGSVKILQFTSLPFGLVSSPAILEQCLKIVTQNLSETTRSLFEKSIYMDDAILAAEKEETLLEGLKEARPVFRAHGFELHKIVSNAGAITANFDTIPGSDQKVLGVRWDTRLDMLGLKIPELRKGVVTKRYILHVVGSLFDPLGLADPVKLEIRSILSHCSEGLDERLPLKAEEVLHRFIDDLPLLKACQVPRDCKGDRLWCYSDASLEAYGYCIYVGTDLDMTFLFGKAKIVPADCKRSVPDLELVALYLATRKAVELLKTLGNRVSQVIFASDSRINLSRLDKPLNELRSFTSSKLINILKLATMHNFKFVHIKGVNNPADVFSRKISIQEYIKDKHRFVRNVPEVSGEFPMLQVYGLSTAAQSNSAVFDSPILGLIRDGLTPTLERIRTVLKAIRKMKRSRAPFVEPILSEAMLYLIRQLQPLVPKKLPGKMSYNSEGLVRIRTRMQNYSPILFPKHEQLILFIIADTHIRLGHAGRDRVCGEISCEYYVENLKKAVTEYLRSCRFCTYARKKAVSQPFGYWPAARTEFSRAFEVVAVDVFGPIILRNRSKVYGLVMVCHTTRAVKIEVLPSLSSKDMLMALQTLFCYVGEPRLILSDNGTNFRRVARDCANILSSLRKVLENTVNWFFSPPEAPWFNATAERLIGCVKRILETIGGKFTSQAELRHVLAQAEKIINSRVLFWVDDEPFTPMYLWQQKKPKPTSFQVSPALSHLYKFSILLKQESCRLEALWSKNYRNILALQTDDRRGFTLQPGQIVLVPDPQRKRLNWSRGVIIKTFPGDDGLVRVVEVRIAGSDRRYCRPAQGLVLFEGNPLFQAVSPPEDVEACSAFETENRSSDI